MFTAHRLSLYLCTLVTLVAAFKPAAADSLWFDDELSSLQWRLADQDEAREFLNALDEWGEGIVFTYPPYDCLLKARVLEIPDVTGDGHNDLVVDLTHGSVLGECPATRVQDLWPQDDPSGFFFHGYVTHRIVFDGAEQRPLVLVDAEELGQSTTELGVVIRLDNGKVGFVSRFPDPTAWHYDFCTHAVLRVYVNRRIETVDSTVLCRIPFRDDEATLRFHEGRAVFESVGQGATELLEAGDELVGAGHRRSDGTEEGFFDILRALLEDGEIEPQVMPAWGSLDR